MATVLYFVLALWCASAVASGVIGWRKGQPLSGLLAGLSYEPYGILAARHWFPTRMFSRGSANSIARLRESWTTTRVVPGLFLLVLAVASFVAMSESPNNVLKSVLTPVPWFSYWSAWYLLFHPNYTYEPVNRGYPFCVNCEYNLTGNESGVCPECGQRLVEDGDKP